MKDFQSPSRRNTFGWFWFQRLRHISLSISSTVTLKGSPFFTPDSTAFIIIPYKPNLSESNFCHSKAHPIYSLLNSGWNCFLNESFKHIFISITIFLLFITVIMILETTINPHIIFNYLSLDITLMLNFILAWHSWGNSWG